MDGAPDGATGSALDAALARLLADTGGQTLRLIDGRSSRVLGTAGWGRRQDVAALVRLAAGALPVTAGDGGLVDLVVTAGRTVHVLRPGPATTVLVLRLGTGDDLDLARRVLAAPQTFGELSVVMPIRSVPVPRRVRRTPLPAVRGGGPLRPGQPALSALAGPAPVLRSPSTGALAALALGGGPVVPLPRRTRPGPAADRRRDGIGDWAKDVATMRHVLAGLRQLF